jgi:hypothetical protein
MIGRYFRLQFICGLVALLHLLAEQLYLGKPPRRLWTGLVVGLLVAAAWGGFWLQPRMTQLHTIKYGSSSTPRQRQEADESFRAWHGFSQAVNLLALAGVGLYLWRAANPNDPTRFVSTTKFRG